MKIQKFFWTITILNYIQNKMNIKTIIQIISIYIIINKNNNNTK